jgi:hypothetical protein
MYCVMVGVNKIVLETAVGAAPYYCRIGQSLGMVAPTARVLVGDMQRLDAIVRL